MAVLFLMLAACSEPLGNTAACNGGIALSVGTPVQGAVEASDCKDERDRVGDYYRFSLSGQTNIEVTMRPDGFEGELSLFAGDPKRLGEAVLIFEVIGPGTIGGHAFLPAGSYFIVAGTAGSKGGGYTLGTGPAVTNGCPDLYYSTLPGATISGTVTTDDCRGGTATVRQDAYGMPLTAGQRVVVTVAMDRVGMVLWRTGSAATPDLVSRTLSQAGTVQFEFTAPRTDAYRVHLLGHPGVVGTIGYTVSIQ
ncbi:MAG TPA: hypothetical protein VK928_07375 [Longimicrobiales bacterium]|nr:hypothetical protein [Longimicrobiales bacterium]